ncbi:hypothetical protein [Hymenobacter arizonensis]|nr:hypothetical protein [Hymenobacter arizonensis]
MIITASFFQVFRAILIADWRERSRSKQFWGVLGLLMISSWWCFPPANASYLTLAFDGVYRGQYSSAWIGMVLALVYSTLLSLVGFYLVRGTLTRDFDTNVWQLLASSSLVRPVYVLAKWGSHMLTLSLFVGIGLAVGLGAQLVRGEDHVIDLLELIKPVLLLGLPALAVTAMFAVWFDVLPWLRRTRGNIIYFIIWICLLTGSIQQTASPVLDLHGWKRGPDGIVSFWRAIKRANLPELDSKSQGVQNLTVGSASREATLVRFSWTSWHPQIGDIVGAGFWIGLALLGTLLTSPFLDWAASYPTQPELVQDSLANGHRLRWLEVLLSPLQLTVLGTLLSIELQLVLRARKTWWWLTFASVLTAQAVGPKAVINLAALAAWLLLLDVFSNAPVRERDTGTAAFIFSAARASRRIFLARWLLLLVLAWGGTLIVISRLFTTMPMAALATVVVGLSLASWSLALGALTRSARPYELLFVVLAYASVQDAPVLNISSDSWATIRLHLLLMPLAAGVFLLSWRRLR